MQIGIAGIGKMGAAIAQRLIEVGHTVTVWNRSADKLKAVTDAGARAVATPTELPTAPRLLSASSPMPPLSTRSTTAQPDSSPAMCAASCSSR
jgi:pyrroline-5-carboxylate reductase